MKISSYLKLISNDESLVIEPTNGNDTIAKAKDVFTCYVDYDFVNFGTDVKGKPTEETLVQVFETIKDGTLAQIFGDFGVILDRLCLEQSQIIQFVKNHTKWLHPSWNGIYFLFKVGNEFFVAAVSWRKKKLIADVFRLANPILWFANLKHRFVIPQNIIDDQ